MRLSEIKSLVASHGARRYAEKRGGILAPLALISPLPSLLGGHAIDKSKEYTEQLEKAEDAKLAGLGWAGKPSPKLPQHAASFGRFNPGMSFGNQEEFKPTRSNWEGSAPPPSGLLGALLGFGGNVGKDVAGASSKGLADVAAAPLKGVGEGIGGGIGEMIKRKMLGREFGERKDPMHLGGSAAIQTFGKGIGEMGVDLLRDMASKAVAAVGQAGDDAAREAILTGLKRTDPVLSSADDKTLMEAYHTMTRFAPVLSTDKNAVRSFLRQAVMSGAGPDYMSIKLLADSERAVTGGNEKRSSFDLKSLLSAAAPHALAGAGIGAVSGAVADKNDRSGGALRGALTGGLTGGLGGALHEHLTRAPTNQGMVGDVQYPSGAGKRVRDQYVGGLGQNLDANTSAMGTGSLQKVLGHPADPTPRWVPEGARQTAEDLRHLDLLRTMNPNGGYA